MITRNYGYGPHASAATPPPMPQRVQGLYGAGIVDKYGQWNRAGIQAYLAARRQSEHPPQRGPLPTPRSAPNSGRHDGTPDWLAAHDRLRWQNMQRQQPLPATSTPRLHSLPPLPALRPVTGH